MPTHYELLPTLTLTPENTILASQELPELVHLEDPALTVMRDFSQIAPLTIDHNNTMDDALNEMQITGSHLLLVTDEQQHLIGILGSEDLLGEKPILLIQERRIERNQVLVKMLMRPLANITTFTFDTVQHARVGNIVNTLQSLKKHYALVVIPNEDDNKQTLRGLFTVSQISKQLHDNIGQRMTQAETVAELQKRSKKT